MAASAGLLARQPLIVAFIFAGVPAGPDAPGIASSETFIETLGQISIAVLPFLVGLRPDLGLVRGLGKVAAATGLGQVVLWVNLEAEEPPLLARGASPVLKPFRDAALHAVEHLTAEPQSGRGASAFS